MTIQTVREPKEEEIEAVLLAFDLLSYCIDPSDGKINAATWRVVYDTLASLTIYELWLGLCNLESVLFDAEQEVSRVHVTLYELFQIAYEDGIQV
jgi:hypothetical protein